MIARKIAAPLAMVLLLALLAVCVQQPAQPADALRLHEEPLVQQVRNAIARGVQYLRAQARDRGAWETEDPASRGNPGGYSSLAMLALLNAGLQPDDPLIQKALTQLRRIPPTQTYVVGLQTMVLAKLGERADASLIQRNADWLVKAALRDGARIRGWSYSDRGPVGPDNSNTQYALLGLHEARVAGARIDPAVWGAIRDYYTRTQSPEGGWGYHPLQDPPSLTMTTAGLCGLIIAGMELNEGREKILPDGTAQNCGDYEEGDNRPLTKALDWIGSHFPPSAERVGTWNHSNTGLGPNVFYSLYGIERAGRLSGQRFLGPYDWYRIGCEYLVGSQQADGSWQGHGRDGPPVVATSFALLFLSKGRTPVLISKLAHGPGDDWNNDRNDARNLVEFASRELFKKQPLAWQVFDAGRTRAESDDAIRDLAGQLLQTPIVYFNGHLAPRFTGIETGEHGLLKQYIENGGFILAEACCGRPEFDAGFRSLVRDLFGADYPLKPLPPGHPVWTASGKFLSSPADFPLYGIEMGCKTVLIYSPTDLSCWWESNKSDAGKGKKAFELGANIIAYATGLEPPKDRGTHVDVVRDNGPETHTPRGALQVGQLKYAGSAADWQPAPRAMRNLMFEMRELGFRVELKTVTLDIDDQSLANFKFLYMHGRNSFSVPSAAELKSLRFNLSTGGMLFADACCGSRAFDQSFRPFIRALFPDEKLQPIPLSDELYSKELNGTALTKVRCRREGSDGKTPEAEFRDVDPYLEGIKIHGRWAVIYSKYDIGCALERSTAGDCRGYDYESALRIATAAVLYNARP
jgi:hypothetical protein